MTREEEIKRASVMYHLYYYDYSYEEGEHLDFYIKGFTEGAMWADKHPVNVWHDTTEEPQDKSHILIRYNYMGSVEFKSYHIDYQCDFKWLELVEIFGVECWAYLDDLLPKGGEQ